MKTADVTPPLPRLIGRRGGSCNVTFRENDSNPVVARCRRLRDVDAFSFVIDARWRYVIVLFCGVFVVSWLLFALIWWGIIVAHGDHLHGGDNNDEADDDISGRDASSNISYSNSKRRPCVSNIYTFNAALLYSIDLQTTLGYGFGEIETECPGAILLFMLHTAFGLFLDGVALGVLFAKLTRPKHRSSTVLFSRYAVVHQLHSNISPSTAKAATEAANVSGDSGSLVLELRLADIRQHTSRLTSAVLSAYVFRFRRKETVKVGTESEADVKTDRFVVDRRPLALSSSPSTLPVTTPTEQEIDSIVLPQSSDKTGLNLMMLWPETVYHRITKGSPLFDILTLSYEAAKRNHSARHNYATNGDDGDEDCKTELGHPTANCASLQTENFEIVVVLEAVDQSTGRQLQVRSSYTERDVIVGHRFKPLSVQQRRLAQNESRHVNLDEFDDTTDVI